MALQLSTNVNVLFYFLLIYLGSYQTSFAQSQMKYTPEDFSEIAQSARIKFEEIRHGDSGQVLSFLSDESKRLNAQGKTIELIINEIHRAEIYIQYFHYDQSLAILDSLENLIGDEINIPERALIYQGKAVMYGASLQNNLAVDYYYRAAFIFEELKLMKRAALCYSKVGEYQYHAKNYANSLENANFALSIIDKIEELDQSLLDRKKVVYNLQGLAYRGLHKHDSAILAFEKALQIALYLEQEFWVALIQGNIASSLIPLGRHDQAIGNLLIDFKISKKYNQWESASNAAIAISEAYFHLNKLDLAKRYLDSAQIMIEEVPLLYGRLGLYKGLSNYYASLGNFKKAFQFNQLYQKYQDSISFIQKDTELNQLKTKYDFAKTLSEFELLKKDNELQNEHYRQNRIITYAVIIIAMLIAFLLITLYFNFQKVKRINSLLDKKVQERTKDLIAKNKELDTYLYRASHDIRRPIASILGLQQLLLMKNPDDNSRQIAEKIKITAQNMDNMLHKIHHLYQIDKITQWEDLDLAVAISGLIKEFETILEVNKIVVELNLTDEISLYTIPELINIALRCIFENSTFYLNKFNDQHKISIDLYIKDGQCVIRCKDNGVGIKESELDDVFDAYVRKNGNSVGSGLGLHIAKKAIEQVGGHIELQSTYGEGTIVSIFLPLKVKKLQMNSL